MRMPYPEYRQCGVGWTGRLPRHWEAAHLGRHVEIVNGGTPASGDEAAWDGQVTWLTPDDLGRNAAKSIATGRRKLTEHGVRSSSATVCPAASVVVSTRAPIGHLAVTSAPAATNQGCRTLVPSAEVESDFVYYALLASRDQLEALGKGSTFMELAPPDLGEHRIPVPPLSEQHSIVSFLDRETARIDELISKQESLIERLEEYRAALVTRTVTRGLPPDAAEAAGLDSAPSFKDSGVEWLGSVPSHWSIARLKWSTAFWINGVWGEEPDGTDDLLCVRVADFDRRSSRVSLDAPTYRQISRSQRGGRLLQPGDLLLEKSGGGIKQLVGCVVRYEHDLPAVCSNFVGRVVLAEDADPAFWTYVHQALYAGRLNYPAIKQTTGIQNLDASAYFDLPVAYPPFEEQQAIAEYLDAQSARVDALRAKAEDSIERLREYRLALVSAAVTGKIDVRESTADGAGGGA